MITIKPFRGLRPANGLAHEIVSPPYDVINSDEARELAKKQKYSYLHIVKPEIDLPSGMNMHEAKVYSKGLENLKSYMTRNLLIQDEKPCLYIYKLTMGDHVQVGLMAIASVEDYKNDRIKKHEYTRLDKEEDRAEHIDCLNAQCGPVFLIYKARDEIQKLIEQGMEKEPDYDFIGDHGVEHTVYIVDDEDLINKIVNAYKTVDALYIADGHHRSAAAERVYDKRMAANSNHTGDESYSYYLTVIFPDDHLRIMDYNRVVKYLNGYSPNALIEAIQDHFDVELYTPKPDEKKQFHPAKLHEFGMYLKSKWYKLTAKTGTFDNNDPVEVLDVFILQENLLAPILDIQNPRTDNRIHFVGGIRGLEALERLVDHGEFSVAFSMYATSIDQLMRIADANRVMPPKSTWFEPKLGSGMVTHLLDED
ncbi:DUF1015 domain-containing protein [candidate division KSB1 bacterium]|nr:DUF1015 domain-containing protein [candidate division KSB1 bacterium]